MNVVIAVIAVAGALFLFLAVVRLRKRRWAAATRNGFFGLLLLAFASLFLGVAANLYTYSRLTYEQEVADISFRQIAPMHYAATLDLLETERERNFEIRGSEWQVDARIIKWHGLANLLGLDTHFRLERLSGRYADVERETTQPRTVYALTDNPGLDMWHIASNLPDWLAVVDAQYGNATYLPIAEGARYRISVSRSGLVARPLNEAARQAVESWK